MGSSLDVKKEEPPPSASTLGDLAVMLSDNEGKQGVAREIWHTEHPHAGGWAWPRIRERQPLHLGHIEEQEPEPAPTMVEKGIN